MSRSLLLVLLIYTLIFIGLASLRGSMLVLAMPLIIYLASGLLQGPRGIDLRVRRHFDNERVQEGQPFEITVDITNQGSKLESVLLEETLPARLTLIDGSTKMITSLATNESVTLTYTVRARRGLYSLPGLRVNGSDYLNLYRASTEYPGKQQIFVLPAVEKLPSVAIRPQRTRVYSGQIPARKGGPGVEFFGVREYQPGDALRWVNHRASNRHEQTLFVNEFEQERAADVGLILDARTVTNLCVGGHSLLDYSVQAAATLADTFITQGNRVGLFIYGGAVDWTFPGYGKIQRERIMQSLARAKVEEHQVFQHLSYLPTKLFPIRSQLVLISPLRPEDIEDVIALRGRGYHLLVIAPDTVDFEQRLLGDSPEVSLATRIARIERVRLFRRLSQAGIRIFEWPVQMPFHQTAQRALSRVPHWYQGPGLI